MDEVKLMTPIQRVLNWARSEVGVKEEGGNNRGPRVAEYLASVGLGVGEPWCAAFIAFCFTKAAGSQCGWPMTADTWTIRDWAKANGCLHESPEAGDVFLIYNSAGPTHTGFVASVQGEYVWTIEGNTGGGSDTDGDGVHHKKRLISGMRFVRWADVLGPDRPPAARVVYAKLFSHDGEHALLLPDGTRLDVVGVKENGKPWAGGQMLIGIREVG